MGPFASHDDPHPGRPPRQVAMEGQHICQIDHLGPVTILGVHRLAEAIETWCHAVEAANTTGYSTPCSEGHNRLAKPVGRNAFGFCNPANQRPDLGQS